MPKSKLRLFVGLALSPDTANQLELVQSELADLGAELRLTPPENFHITLKFLGSVKRDQLDVITHRLDAIASKTTRFNATLKGLETFPRTGHVEVIWADLDEGTSQLKSLMREIAESLKDITPKDSSKARQPHVTLARVKSGGNAALRKCVEANQDRVFGSLKVDTLHVYQSQLSQEGAKYRVLRSFELNE